MLNDYEITRVETEKNNPILSLLKLIACSLAVYCSLLIAPDFMEEVYETRDSIVEDSLKIRVVANSNSNTDQQLKNEIVENLTPFFLAIQKNELSNVDNDEIYAELASFVEKNYAQYDVKINFGDNLIPPKLEEHTFYPQSVYNSLVLTIGAGRGDNFWCSIFPNVCEKPSEEAKGEESEEETEVTFIVWEWIKSLFS